MTYPTGKGHILGVLSAILCTFSLWGQPTKTFQAHLGAGPILYRGDLSADNLGLLDLGKVSFQTSLHYRLNDFVALGLQANAGTLRANDLDFTSDPLRQQRRFRFTTDYTEVAISSRFYLFGEAQWQPYLGLGAGVLFFQPDAYLLDNTLPELDVGVKTDVDAEIPSPSLSIPTELGVNLRAAELFSVQAGLRYHFTFTDYLDGISAAGDPNGKDYFGSVFAGVSIHFGGPKDQDQDGIADQDDTCPLKPGSPRTKGCPDQDDDGIRDGIDRCPLAAGTPELEGCPDSDGDGTPDPFDRCPAQAGPRESLGCPPRDSDQDGVFDHEDKCPLEPGPVDREGCPLVDTDQDGILDEDDRCPGLPGQALFEGCPDSDGDGIDDTTDTCPSSFGPYAYQGCPVVNTLTEKVALLQAQVLRFPAGGAEVNNYALLDQFVVFLRNNQRYQLFIEGHGDATGSEDAVGYLSQLRAERVKRYLLSKGIAEQQVVMLATSGRQPQDESGTPRGQALNRRVEFRLVGG
ncbi:MAG: thrombospondin type 3 repeat-containing protein [Bacteroidota bacterium]